MYFPINIHNAPESAMSHVDLLCGFLHEMERNLEFHFSYTKDIFGLAAASRLIYDITEEAHANVVNMYSNFSRVASVAVKVYRNAMKDQFLSRLFRPPNFSLYEENGYYENKRYTQAC